MALSVRKIVAGSVLAWLLLTTVHFATAQLDPLFRPGQTYSAPFQHDERLLYEVNWKPLFLLPAFRAGQLEFRTEETVYQNRPVYKIVAEVRSTGRLASVAGIDVRDYFESIFDRESFRSYRLVKRIREGKRQRNMELIFDYPKDRLLVREHDVAVKPARELRNQSIAKIAEPLVDVVSVFYIGRLRSLETGERFFTYLVDEGELKRIEMSVVKKEKVNTEIGNFPAVRINTNGKIFNSGGNLRVWYSTDQLRVPVKFEADVSFGKVYGTLSSIQTPTATRGRIRSK